MKILSIIIPVYNEENTLASILDKVLDVELGYGFKKEVIIIDDASEDSTGKIAKSYANKYSFVKVLSNEKNLGKSQSVKRGILESKGDYIVIQDADLEYEPADLADMLNLLLQNGYDVVYGNRFGRKNKITYVKNYLGNKFISFVTNLFTFPRLGVWNPDVLTCYKLIDGNIARKLAPTLTSTSCFGFDPEITAKLSKYIKSDGKRIRLGVYPIHYYPRTIEEGKKLRAFQDGFKTLKEIFYYNLAPMKLEFDFEFKEVDEEGEEALEVLALAPRFNRWMFEVIKPYSKGIVLEIGSGIGNLTEQYVSNGYDVVASDIRESYCIKLREKFGKNKKVKEVVNLDIVDKDFDNKYSKFFGKFDTVVALNVIEHIKDDFLAIHNIGKLLKKGGKAIILVPSYQLLYNRLDKELCHYRRYNIKLLKSRFMSDEYEVKDTFYFNFAGIIGWFVSGKLQNNKTIPKLQIQIYNFLVPFFKVIDSILLRSMGLSTICIAEKK